MTELYFKKARGVVMKDPEGLDELAELKRNLPRNAQRRMTLMGMMAHYVMGEESLADVPAIVYATAFAESRTLEKYLASFPQPSPMAFQASIHPSAVEQSLILRRQAVPYFLPLAGLEAFFQGLRVAMTLPPDSLFVGAEERGTWLAEKNLSSLTTFAWAWRLTTRDDAEGKLVWRSDERSAITGPAGTYAGFAEALAHRRGWSCQRPGWGEVQLRWS